MQIGNRRYKGPADIPAKIAVFPLSGALLLPRGQLPLNIFEPRYLAMIDHVLASPGKLVGIVQPRSGAKPGDRPELCGVGCIGRLTQWSETGDGRYMVALTGVCRFEIVSEDETEAPFRTVTADARRFAGDFHRRQGEDAVDRPALVAALRSYLDVHGLEANWEAMDAACNEVLVNAMAMMSPFGPEEKQLLLEAPDLKTRADTIIAMAERDTARHSGGGQKLQ